MTASARCSPPLLPPSPPKRGRGEQDKPDSISGCVYQKPFYYRRFRNGRQDFFGSLVSSSRDGLLALQGTIRHNRCHSTQVSRAHSMATPGEHPPDIFQAGGGLREDLLTKEAYHALRESLRLTRETRWDTIRSPHVFMGLIAVPDVGVRNWGERLRADLSRLLAQFQELFDQPEGEAGAPLALHREFLSDNVIRLLRESLQRARDHQRSVITPMDLLITLLTAANSIVAECFERIGVTAAKLTEHAVIAEQSSRDDRDPGEKAPR